MSISKNAPLMAGTRLFLSALLLLLYVTTALIGLGVVTIAASMALEGAASGFARGDGLLVSFLLLFLLTSIAFFRLLQAVVHSVAEGDPFNRENPVRLTRLAWLALIVWAVDLIFVLWQSAPFSDAATKAEFGEFTADLIERAFGLVGPITLFILARVFRHGAMMREDLEGTV